MRYQLRIIAGSLRGRKVTVEQDAGLRPMTDRAREALFSILQLTIPGRPFFDVFAGSGAVGMEAISRGASSVVFVERESRAAAAINKHLEKFGVADQGRVIQADSYRWADKGAVPTEPAIVFVGPPYNEFVNHFDAVFWLMTAMQQKLAPGSVLVMQSESQFPADQFPLADQWDVRHYGRTQLALWTKPVEELGGLPTKP